jgi:hypothetical protein
MPDLAKSEGTSMSSWIWSAIVTVYSGRQLELENDWETDPGEAGERRVVGVWAIEGWRCAEDKVRVRAKVNRVQYDLRPLATFPDRGREKFGRSLDGAPLWLWSVEGSLIGRWIK